MEIEGNLTIDTRENIVTDGLAHYVNAANRNSYPRTGTIWYDLSGNNRNGTAYNSTYSNESIYFTGSGDVQFSQYDFGNEFTFIAFINPTSKNNISAFFANSGTGTNTNGIRIFMNYEFNNNRTLNIELGNGSSGGFISSPINTVTYGVWQQVAFTLNKNTAKGSIYHNGIKVKESNLNITNFNTNAEFRIGSIRGGYAYIGSISNFATYNRELTPAEIQKNYIQGYGKSDLTIF